MSADYVPVAVDADPALPALAVPASMKRLNTGRGSTGAVDAATGLPRMCRNAHWGLRAPVGRSCSHRARATPASSDLRLTAAIRSRQRLSFPGADLHAGSLRPRAREPIETGRKRKTLHVAGAIEVTRVLPPVRHPTTNAWGPISSGTLRCPAGVCSLGFRGKKRTGTDSVALARSVPGTRLYQFHLPVLPASPGRSPSSWRVVRYVLTEVSSRPAGESDVRTLSNR